MNELKRKIWGQLGEHGVLERKEEWEKGKGLMESEGEKGKRSSLTSLFCIVQQQTCILGETTGDGSLLFHPAVPLTFTWYFPVLFQPWTILWIWLLPTSLQQKLCCSGRHQWVEWRTTSLFSHTLQVGVCGSRHQGGTAGIGAEG